MLNNLNTFQQQLYLNKAGVEQNRMPEFIKSLIHTFPSCWNCVSYMCWGLFSSSFYVLLILGVLPWV